MTHAEPAPQRIDTLRRSSRREKRAIPRPDVLAVVVLWLTALLVTSAFMTSARGVSVIDEAPHLDYVLRMPDDFPRAGEPMLQETLDIWSCRRMERDLNLPACGSGPYDPADYPYQGRGLAGSHPPVYYVVTAAVGGVLHALTPLDKLDSFRAVGVLWLGGAMTATYLLARRLGASRTGTVGVLLMTAAVTSTVARAGAVGPDIAAWFTGTLVLLAAVTHRGRWWQTLAFLLACVLAALTKQTAFMAVGAAMIYLVASAPLSEGPAAMRPRAWWRTWVLAIAGGLVFVVPSMSWMMLNTSMATENFDTLEQNQIFLVDHFPLTQILLQAFSFLTPVSDGPSSLFMNSTAQRNVNTLIEGTLLLGLLAALFLVRTRPAAAALAWGTALLLVAGGPILAVANYVSTSTFFELKPRYGYPVLAGMVTAAACSFHAKHLRWALLAGGIIMIGMVILQSSFLGIVEPALVS